MLEGSNATFGVAIVWLLVCVVAWLGVQRLAGRWSLEHPRLVIIAAAAVARLVPILVLDRGLPFDIEAHWTIGSLVLAGSNVYTAPLAQGRYPYPPLHGIISAALVWLAQGDRTLYLALDKLAPALCGIGIALAVRTAAMRLGQSPAAALRAGLLYALNPLPVMVTAYHGQFEEIPLLFIVLAILLLLDGPARGRARAMALSALFLGVAIAYKSWPVLFLLPPLLLIRRRRWQVAYVLSAAVPLGVSLAAYRVAFGPAGLREAVGTVLGYRGSEGFCWGYVSVFRECWVHPAALRPNPWLLGTNERLLVAALVVLAALLILRRRPLEGLVTLPLAFYLFAPGWGPNYTIWVLPGALLLSPRLARLYTLTVVPVVTATYLDALYIVYKYSAWSWAVMKPVEAWLGFAAWIGLVILLLRIYGAPWIRLSWLMRPSPWHACGGAAYAGGLLGVVLLAVAVDFSGAPSGFTLNLWQPITWHLGLDFGGGTQLLLKPLAPRGQPVGHQMLEAEQRRVRQRLDGTLGVSEPRVQTTTIGQQRYIGVTLAQQELDSPDLARLIEGSGRFALVALDGALLPRGASARAYPVLASIADVIPSGVAVGLDPVTSGPVADVALREAAVRRVNAYAAATSHRFIGIAVDGRIYDSRPSKDFLLGNGFQVRRIWPTTTITNVNNLIVTLRHGTLPLPLRPAKAREVGATFAEDLIQDGIVIGLVLIAACILWLIALYRVLGLVAALAILFTLIAVTASVKLAAVAVTPPVVMGAVLSMLLAGSINIANVRRVARKVQAGKAPASGWPLLGAAPTLVALCSLVLWRFGGSYPSGGIADVARMLFIGTGLTWATAIASNESLLYPLARVEAQHVRQGRDVAWGEARNGRSHAATDA